MSTIEQQFFNAIKKFENHFKEKIKNIAKVKNTEYEENWNVRVKWKFPSNEPPLIKCSLEIKTDPLDPNSLVGEDSCIIEFDDKSLQNLVDDLRNQVEIRAKFLKKNREEDDKKYEQFQLSVIEYLSKIKQ